MYTWSRYCNFNCFGHDWKALINMWARMYYDQKDLHAKSELGRGQACGMKKKDEQDECQDGYFGTLPTLWLMMNRSTYLEKWRTLYCTCFYISTWTWVSASSTVKGTEAVSRRSDKARVNTKMFLIIIIINQDILRRILVLLISHPQLPVLHLANPHFFWSFDLMNDKTSVLEHSHLRETINYPKDKLGHEVAMARHHFFHINSFFRWCTNLHICAKKFERCFEYLWITLNAFCSLYSVCGSNRA